VCVCMCVCARACVCACGPVCVFVCMCSCVCIFAHTPAPPCHHHRIVISAILSTLLHPWSSSQSIPRVYCCLPPLPPLPPCTHPPTRDTLPASDLHLYLGALGRVMPHLVQKSDQPAGGASHKKDLVMVLEAQRAVEYLVRRVGGWAGRQTSATTRAIPIGQQ
jgi:hypothetical protein